MEHNESHSWEIGDETLLVHQRDGDGRIAVLSASPYDAFAIGMSLNAAEKFYMAFGKVLRLAQIKAEAVASE